MRQHSSETRLSATSASFADDGPLLEYSPPTADASDHGLRIHARRVYPAPREDVFAAWTSRPAWDSWMRLRARSRSTLAAYRGGAFRLELSEGPMIHVITGTFVELQAAERLTLTWQHEAAAEHTSTVHVLMRSRSNHTELSLAHTRIGSRREAAWLMRLWTTVLRRLGAYLIEPIDEDRAANRDATATTELLRARAGTSFARSAGIAVAAATIALHGTPPRPSDAPAMHGGLRPPVASAAEVAPPSSRR